MVVPLVYSTLRIVLKSGLAFLSSEIPGICALCADYVGVGFFLFAFGWSF